MSQKKNLIPVRLDMPPSSVQRIDRIKEHTSTSSRANVISQAMQLYEWMIEQVADGGKKVYVGELKEPVSTVQEVKVFHG